MNDEARPDSAPRLRIQIVIFGVLTALIVLGWAIGVRLSGGDSAPQAAVVADEGSEQPVVNSAPVTTVAAAPTTTTTIVDDDLEVLVDEEPAEAVADEGNQGDVAESASVTTVAVASTTIVADEPVVVGVAVSPVSTAAPSAPGVEPSPPFELSYATLPDGSPVPVIALFDVETITLSGAVPSEDARSRLEILAVANSKFPNATIVDSMTLNPDVPISVGVRVIELNSVRFPESSARISNEHATELDRVGAIMNALPNISVLVIGHADQRGSADANYKISEQRAQAVTSYLAGQGISPERMSSRAVGAEDLYTFANDDAALALNRRTEFVFYGLLVG